MSPTHSHAHIFLSQELRDAVTSTVSKIAVKPVDEEGAKPHAQTGMLQGLRMRLRDAQTELPTASCSTACWPETTGHRGHVSGGDAEHPFPLPKTLGLSESQLTAGVREPMPL